MKKIIIIILFLIIVCAAAWGYIRHRRLEDSRPVQYEFAEVTRATVEKVIVSAGTLYPVGSVEVGTQVSGTVDKVHVDFNDTVRAGQVIAEIDRSVLLSRLHEAQASLSRAEALFAQSEMEHKRGETLYEKGLISEQEFVKLSTDFHTQKASLQVAQAAVTTAQENIRYTTIRSPVRGTVISRNVEVGQTVAASLSAPTLFVIAEDLRRMKIMAQVDETDIGRIREAQEVRFTVQAYPEKNYAGSVSQVRLQPEVVQNVVTYTVVILARNDDGTLLPGMTANVEFVEAREPDALTVPMAALRFKPPEEVVVGMLDDGMRRGHGRGGVDGDESQSQSQSQNMGGKSPPERKPKNFEQNNVQNFLSSATPSAGTPRNAPMLYSPQPPSERGAKSTSTSTAKSTSTETSTSTAKSTSTETSTAVASRPDGGEGRGRKSRQGNITPGGRGVLWTIDEEGNFKPVHVRLGLNDGVRTVVTGRGDELREGMKVVSGQEKKDKGKKKGDGKQPTKTLLPQGGGGGGGPRRI